MVQIKPGTHCPLIKKDCIQMQCNWFMQVRGYDSNTGKEIDEWGCAVAWLPTLLIENANQMRQAGAATESFRNEFVKSTQETINTMIAVTNDSKPNEIPMRLVHEKTDDN